MTKAEALARLRDSEMTLRAMGIEHLSIFGSTARGDERPGSDVDLAARFSKEAFEAMDAFEYLEIEDRIGRVLDTKVDLVSEPSRHPRLQAQIDRDRVDVF